MVFSQYHTQEQAFVLKGDLNGQHRKKATGGNIIQLNAIGPAASEVAYTWYKR